MKERNTDIRDSFANMLDSVVELFNGKLTINEVLNMDLPMMKALCHARLKNLEKRKSQSPSTSDLEKSIRSFFH